MSAPPTGTTERAYRICAEMLGNMQRLLERALGKRCGKGWFNADCPPEVFRRVVARKETELQVDRCAGEYQELMSYTDFRDLGDIVVGIEGAASMFGKLASTEASFVAALMDLEAVRGRLCLGHAVSDLELEALEEIYSGFTTFVARTKQKGGAKKKGAQPTWDSRSARPGAAQAASAEVPKPLPVEEPPAEETLADEPTVDEPPADALPTAPTAVPVSQVAPPAAEDDSEMLDGWDLEEAVEADNHEQVLKSLRREVTRIAEAIYGNVPCPRPRAWTTVHLSGWHDEHEAALGLGPLSHFYGMVHEYRIWQAEGQAAEDMVARLEEQGFPALLLELRQLFMVSVK